MGKYWRMIVASMVIGGSGCCHNCGCCDSWNGGNGGDNRPPTRLNDGPAPLGVPPRAPTSDTVPPVGPRPGVGAYGGS